MSRQQQVIATCAECSTSLEYHLWRDKGKFCSKKCRDKYWNRIKYRRYRNNHPRKRSKMKLLRLLLGTGDTYTLQELMEISGCSKLTIRNYITTLRKTHHVKIMRSYQMENSVNE